MSGGRRPPVAEREARAEVLAELKTAALERVRSHSILTLTPPIIESVVAMVQEGNYRDTAARALGVPATRLEGWLRTGREQWERIEDGADPVDVLSDHDPDGLQLELFIRCERADAEAEVDLIRECRTRADDGRYWQAHMTLASRRWPRRWADRKPEGGTERRFEDELAIYLRGQRDGRAIDRGAEEEIVVEADGEQRVRELGP